MFFPLPLLCIDDFQDPLRSAGIVQICCPSTMEEEAFHFLLHMVSTPVTALCASKRAGTSNGVTPAEDTLFLVEPKQVS